MLAGLGAAIVDESIISSLTWLMVLGFGVVLVLGEVKGFFGLVLSSFSGPLLQHNRDKTPPTKITLIP